jgi:hypothetical protein
VTRTSRDAHLATRPSTRPGARPRAWHRLLAGATLLVLGGCAVTGTASTSDGDVVDATRRLVATVDVSGDRVGADLPVLEREVTGPTECLEGDGYQGSIAWTLVLPSDADPDDVLATVERAWTDEGLEVARDDGDPDLPRVDAEGDDGARYTAELVRATMTLHHLATTDCRPLPDDVGDADVLRGSFSDRADPDGEPVTQDVTRSLADQVDDLRRGSSG